MRVLIRVLGVVVRLTLLVAVVGNIVSSVLVLTSLTRLNDELTGSMSPAIRPGDLVVYRPEAASHLRVGQVISFYREGSADTITHRVATVDLSRRLITVTTRGDANRDADPAVLTFRVTQTVWRVALIVTGAGIITADLLGRHGLVLVLGLIPLALLLPWLEKVFVGTQEAPDPNVEASDDPTFDGLSSDHLPSDDQLSGNQPSDHLV